MSHNLVLAEYDSWTITKQGLPHRAQAFMIPVNRTLFGKGRCTLSGKELDKRSGLQARNRLRGMWDAASGGLIKVTKRVTRGGITNFLIERVAITAQNLVDFATERWGKGLDNSIVIRRNGRLLPGFHESMFAADVGDVLHVTGDSRDDIKVWWDDQSVGTPKKTRKQGVKRPARQISRKAADGSVGSKTVEHWKKGKTETNGPTREAGARAPRSRLESSSLGEHRLGKGPKNQRPRSSDTRAVAAESRLSSIETWMAQIEGLILGNSEKYTPAVTPPGPRKVAESPQEASRSHPDLVALQALVISLVSNPDDVKPLPATDKMEKKLLRAMKKLGGVEKAAKFLTYAIEQKPGWVYNFNWRDCDVYLLLCSGARKEWVAATTKPSALKSTKGRSMSSAAIRNRKMRRDEWTEEGDDKESGW